MIKLIAAVIVIALAGLAASALLTASSSRSALQSMNVEDGAIAGRVLDADGHPIVGAIVFAERPDVILRPTPRAWTNKDGEFEIVNLGPALYVLHTAKDSDGYPHSDFNFYDEGESSDVGVQVSAHQTTRSVMIQRGLKAAVLQGIIVDATTNQPVKHAQITARRVDRPERFLSTGLFWHVGEDPLKFVEGGFKFLVPSSLAFTLKVSAPGYEDWYYKDSETQQSLSALLLAPDTTKELRVALHRQPLRRRH